MKLCQLEFYSRDVEASLAFAEAMLGWRKVPVAIQDQAVIMVPEDSPYGISIRSRAVSRPEAGSPGLASQNKSEAAWSEQAASPSMDLTAYFESNETLSALRERCLALGGLIIKEPTPVTGYGSVMVVEDQGGLRYGLYEAHFEGPRRTVGPLS